MKMFYSRYKELFDIHGENYHYYFSEGFLDEGKTYLLKLEKEKCNPPCDKCGTRTKKQSRLKPSKPENEFNVGTWKYFGFREKYYINYCPKCCMLATLEKENKVDWKTLSWSNTTYEPGYPKDICHTCKYFMWHSLIWCPICGQNMSKHKLSNAQLKEQYPDYRTGY